MDPGRQESSNLGHTTNTHNALEADDQKIHKLRPADSPTLVVHDNEGAHHKPEHGIHGHNYPWGIDHMDDSHNMDGRFH